MHEVLRFQSVARLAMVSAIALGMSTGCGGGDSAPAVGSVDEELSTRSLRVSASANLSSPDILDQATLAGREYVFLKRSQGVTSVAFYLDDTSMSRAPLTKASAAPWDLEGEAADGTANPFDTSTLANGAHTLTAKVLNASGATTLTAAFTIANAAGPAHPPADAGAPPPADGGTPPPPPADGGTTHAGRTYPVHTNIVSTTFWVGEIFNGSLADGSQVCSTYDQNWAFHWSGVNKGTVPANAAGCAGAIIGGCDGVSSGNACATEARTATNGFFPTSAPMPHENPFYLDLPYDDVNDATAFAERCSVIPWANDPGYVGHCADGSFSYMKNRWVKITGPNGHTCYGQNEDAGPSHGSLYHDKAYVFGTTNAQPVQGQFNNAGMDVSPALNGCLGYAELDGENDKVTWQFVDAVDVPVGPWKTVVTTSQVQ